MQNNPSAVYEAATNLWFPTTGKSSKVTGDASKVSHQTVTPSVYKAATKVR